MINWAELHNKLYAEIKVKEDKTVEMIAESPGQLDIRQDQKISCIIQECILATRVGFGELAIEHGYRLIKASQKLTETDYGRENDHGIPATPPSHKE